LGLSSFALISVNILMVCWLEYMNCGHIEGSSFLKDYHEAGIVMFLQYTRIGGMQGLGADIVVALSCTENVENLSAKEILQQHVKHAKKVRASYPAIKLTKPAQEDQAKEYQQVCNYNPTGVQKQMASTFKANDTLKTISIFNYVNIEVVFLSSVCYQFKPVRERSVWFRPVDGSYSYPSIKLTKPAQEDQAKEYQQVCNYNPTEAFTPRMAIIRIHLI
ncbi:hypothetical protein Tco_1011364, partial [Tanacetum coccineum]